MKSIFALWVLMAAPLFAGTFPEETFSIDNVKVNGRTFIHSCSYYSNAESELELEFKSGPVDYGTRVFVEFGWGGSDEHTKETFEWKHKSELELASRPFTTWTGKLSQTIAERSSSTRILDLNFVFRIQEPGKAPRYVGGPKRGDTFVAHLLKVEDSPCVSAGQAFPDFSELVVQVVRQ